MGWRPDYQTQPYELYDGLAHLSAIQETAIERYLSYSGIVRPDMMTSWHGDAFRITGLL